MLSRELVGPVIAVIAAVTVAGTTLVLRVRRRLERVRTAWAQIARARAIAATPAARRIPRAPSAEGKNNEGAPSVRAPEPPRPLGTTPESNRRPMEGATHVSH